MDYLVRDSHFSGVNVGKFDLWYLIHSLTPVPLGTGGFLTLGISPKGVKAYEAFALARQLMNRTVYYQRGVKALEFTMEHFLALVLQNEHRLSSTTESVRASVPDYFRRVAKLIRTESNFNKNDFMASALNGKRPGKPS